MEKSSDHIALQWEVPKCDTTLPVVDYYVTVSSSGESRNISHKIPARCLIKTSATSSSVSLNISNHYFECGQSLNFGIEPCTDHIIYVEPVYNAEWTSAAAWSSIVAWTARSSEDQLSNFSAHWQSDLLFLTWSGLNCSHDFVGWKLINLLNPTSSVTIPQGCSFLTDSNNNHLVRIKRDVKSESVICNDDMPHCESTLAPIQACVTYNFSLIPTWRERNTIDLTVYATAQPLLKGILILLKFNVTMNER